MRKRMGWLGVALFLVVAGLGQFVAPPVTFASEGATLLQNLGNEIAAIVEKTRPAVVQIYSTKIVRRMQRDPFEELDQFFNLRRRPAPREPQVREFPMRGLGSGFFISPDGVILTNSHVVADSDDLEVVLDNGKKYKAILLGNDPLSEIAVIKIDETNLPYLEIGDSASLKVGHFVIAIGSPQGLSQSVTFGIVSAVKRAELGISTFGSYIQTDAAINQGNSGGPLLNTQGKVVGINTAIISTTGGSQGLGLAFPIHEAMDLVKMIQEDGKVSRGYLGIVMQELDPEMAEYFNAKDETGAVVTQIVPGSPAAGRLRIEDVIVGIDGVNVDNTRDVMNRIAAMRPGRTVELNILRNGRKRNISIRLGTRPDGERAEVLRQPGKAAEPDAKDLDLGFRVETLTPEKAQALGLEDEKGLLVAQVEPTSEAYRRGLRPNMLILQVNQRDVNTIPDLQAALDAGKDRPSVLLRVKTPEGSRLLLLPKAPQ